MFLPCMASPGNYAFLFAVKTGKTQNKWNGVSWSHRRSVCGVNISMSINQVLFAYFIMKIIRASADHGIIIFSQFKEKGIMPWKLSKRGYKKYFYKKVKLSEIYVFWPTNITLCLPSSTDFCRVGNKSFPYHCRHWLLGQVSLCIHLGLFFRIQ